ncbi:MAG: hypothetical protein HY287_05830 [Planctomycetes bacterium]|nr:hypothetical protein [Planctomycetota bacterium]
MADALANGPDISFCELYQLSQFGRLADTAAFAATTTSWNVGTNDAGWYSLPDTRHPFIAENIYRLTNDRFEQIGQSWVKHGFFALNGEQCGTLCTYEPGHSEGDWLGVGCTDTYESSLNADRGSLGPRSEINPWTGGYTYFGSYLSQSHPSPNAIQNRLQVKDGDFNPPQNPGAVYFLEGYYVHYQDVNVMNSAGWRPIIMTGGSPGGIWTFDQGVPGQQPIHGFAIDAWTGARQTVIAQIVPPVKNVSPDGRCILAVKATGLGANQWHYEYALLNIDMDRQVGSFSVPIPPTAHLTNVAFHAVASHDEASVDNNAWTSTVTTSAITWTTVNNPLRWGTLYSFRFDADAPPGDVTATLGLFKPGSPTSVAGVTTGPVIPVPAVSTWGLVMLALAITLSGAIIHKRAAARASSLSI